MRVRLLFALLFFSLAPALAIAQRPAVAPASERSAGSPKAIEPKAGWEPPTCSKVLRGLDESIFGAFAGLVLVALPALILVGLGHRKSAGALAVIGAAAGASIVFWLYMGIAPEPACGSYNSPADIDAHLDSDSLYRLWTRFSAERDPTRQRTLAAAVECERRRLSALAPWGEDAVRLAQSRVATRQEFDALESRLRGVIGAPGGGPGCHVPNDTIAGRLLDAETGQPVFGMVAFPGSLPRHSDPSDGRFVFDRVSVAGDSATLYACARGYDLAKQRVRIRDTEGRTFDVLARKSEPVRGGSESVDARPDSCLAYANGQPVRARP